MKGIILTLFLIICIVKFTPIIALEMQSGEYTLEIEDVQQPTPADAPTEEFIESAPIIKHTTPFNELGFEIKNNYGSFTYTISNSRISFKNLQQEPKQSQTIALHPYGDQVGYQLFIQEVQAFQTRSNNKIKATTCSNTHQTCTAKIAQPWTETDNYGFGYNSLGKTAYPDFIDETYFRPLTEKEAIGFASSTHLQHAEQLELTFKVNSPSILHEQSYQGVVSIIALPKL